MHDDQAFLRAVLANPEDNTVRLVYADWLEEHDDPRAAFLRLEVALNQIEPNARPGELREQLHQARHRLDARWLAMMDRPQPGWRIVRMRRASAKTYGKALPAFIHNGNYFLSTVDVYADGAINCWGGVDLPLFRDKLAQDWVVPQAEVGSRLSIHNLGQALVAAVEWDHTSDDIERKVMETLRELNPTMEGLIDMQGSDTEIREGIRTSKLGFIDGKPYRVTLDGQEVAGAVLPVLEVVAGGYRLRHWLIYADGLTQLGYANELLPLEAVGQMFTEGRLTLSVPEGAWVTLDGLGRFQAGEGWWGVEPGERIREASDLIDQLNGGQGAILRCVEAHRAYESDPNEERREALRQAYEAVPVHRRMFCGDMDTKDWPIRRILYGERNEDEEPE